MMMKAVLTFGQVAFEAYCQKINVALSWTALKESDKAGWEAAATAVLVGSSWKSISSIPDPRAAHTVDDRQAKPL